MTDKTRYVINTDVRYTPLEVVDVPALVAACTDPWWNQTLCAVNDTVIRLGILKGEFHWHKHDETDEHFFVLDGSLFVDTREKTFTLAAKQGVTVPRGTEHRTRSPEGAVVLMTAREDVVPTGD